MLAGVLVGPFTGGFTVVNVHDIEQLAELGVALLLFSLGLELSFRELKPVRTVALGGATIQIVLTIALGLALGLALGWEWRAALWFGALISLSSTIVVLKTIQGQGRLRTLSSRVMLGILIVQDLAVVPLMIVLPELSDPAGGLIRVGAAALRAFLLLGVIVLVATRLVPRLMAFVARWNSPGAVPAVDDDIGIRRWLRHVVIRAVDGARRLRGGPRDQRIRIRAPGPQRHRAAPGSVWDAVLRVGGDAA